MDYFMFGSIIAFIPLVVFMLIQGNSILAIFLFFCFCPFILTYYTSNEEAKKLPARYQFNSFRLYISLMIFFPIITSFVFLIEVGFSSLITSPNTFTPDEWAFGMFMLLFVFISLLFFIIPPFLLRDSTVKYRTTAQKKITDDESVIPFYKAFKTYKWLNISIFSILAIGTILVLILSVSILLNLKQFANHFRDFQYFERYSGGYYVNEYVLKIHIITSYLYLGFSILTLFIFFSLILFWFKRMIEGLIGWKHSKIKIEEGKSVLDELVYSGFYNALKEELKAEKLAVRLNGNPFHITCAEINRPFLTKRNFIILLNPYVFSILSMKEREAVIWHEIGHIKPGNQIWKFLSECLFNIWGEQVNRILNDSVIEEKNADQFVIKKMGTSEHIIAVLERLNSLFKEVKFFPREKRLKTFYSIVKIMYGVRKIIYWHPEFETRLFFLKKDICQLQIK